MKFEPVRDTRRLDGLGATCIALLPAGGELWDDFLCTIGVPLERFCQEGPGGWMLGYMDALASQDVRTVLILISAQTSSPRRFLDAASGNLIVVLPACAAYLKARRHFPTYRQMSQQYGRPDLRSRLASLAGSFASHASTPLARLSKEIRLHRCSAILCQEYEYFRFDASLILAKRLRLPIFASYQGSSVETNRLSRVWKASLIRRTDGLIIASGDEITRVHRAYGRHVRVAQIFNPVDIDQWHGAEREQARANLGAGPETCLVVWHGRIAIHDKGLDVMLAAWERVRRARRGRDLRLLLMGSGEDAERLRQMLDQTADLAIQWDSRYVTERAAIRRFLAAGDVFAFPSRNEGFAVAPIEAMACGLPVAAAAASGIADIFRSEADGGLVVPCGDAVAFADALGDLVDDPDRRARLAAAARRRVENAFSLEVVGRQLRTFMLAEDRG